MTQPYSQSPQPGDGQFQFAASQGQPYPGPQAQPGYDQPAAQQSYGQPPMGAPQPPNPYGVAPQPYMGVAPQQKPARPGPATAASAIGIVDGSLGIIVATLGFLGVATVHSLANTARLSYAAGTILALSYLYVFGVLMTAVALLVGGIQFLGGKGYTILLIGAFIQAAVVLLNIINNVMIPSDNMLWVVNVIIGWGLAGTIIFLMLKPECKRWGNS